MTDSTLTQTLQRLLRRARSSWTELSRSHGWYDPDTLNVVQYG